MDCTYCSSPVDEHDPVFVREDTPDGDLTGGFCNYACLSTHIEESDLLTGACCRWEPDE
jgi:hypothetical protein